MKNIVYFLLLTSHLFFGQSNFDKANMSYKKGNYSEAISQYQAILQTKKHAPELYFNLANCYYKLNKVAPAIYNYEKALLLNPNDDEIRNNLQFAQKLQIDEIKVLPKVGFSKAIQNLTGTFTFDTWAWIAIFLSLFFLGAFIGYYFSKTTLSKRIFFIAMFILIFSTVNAVAAAIYERNVFVNEKPAIVFSEIVSLKSEPKKSSTDVLILHEGTKVYILENVDKWLKVQLTDDTTGWIEESSIKEIKKQ